MLGKIVTALREETTNLHPRLRLLQIAVFFLPPLCFNRLRTALYRAAGVSIGRGTLVMGTLQLTGGGDIASRLRVGEKGQLTAPLLLDLNAPIQIGSGVRIGHHVKLITTSHEIGDASMRAGVPAHAPIVIEDGVWIAACAVILPGVTVGRGAVVAAGAVVTRSVPPNTLVGGVPAKPIKSLDAGDA